MADKLSFYASLIFTQQNATLLAKKLIYHEFKIMSPDRKSLIKRTEIYVKDKLSGEHTGHDWYHVQRVRRTAMRIQKREGGDAFIVELTALLHDLGDYKKHGFSESKGNLVLDAMMDILEIERDLQKRVLRIVSRSQYKGDETKKPKTLECRIIQDADWLESLGAIGIARTFATGGTIERPIYDPDIKPRKKLSRIAYQKRKHEGTSFNYFYEKTIKLPKMMNTQTGKRIAERRVKFLKIFMEEFLAEWEGER